MTTLLDRLEKATGEDRELDADLCLAFGLPCSYIDNLRSGRRERIRCADLTASLDAVLGLVEEKLPGWRVWLNQLPVASGLGWEGQLWSDENPAISPDISRAPTPALALLKALVQALERG